MKAWLLAILLLLMIPSSVGQTTADLIWDDGEEGHLMKWIIYSQNLGDGAGTSFSDNGTWLKFTSFDKAISQSIMHVDAWVSITVQSTEDGAWNYTFDATIGSDFSGCSKTVITRDPGVLGGSPVAYYSFPIRCEVLVSDAIEDQSFTWWINRTVESGNPDIPLGQQFSVRLDRSDFIVTTTPTTFETTTGLTAIEFAFLIGLLLVGLYLWGAREGFAVRIVGVLLVGMTAGLLVALTAAGDGSTWGFLLPLSLLVTLLFGYMLISFILDARKQLGVP